jgi:hypothetical protein
MCERIRDGVGKGSEKGFANPGRGGRGHMSSGAGETSDGAGSAPSDCKRTSPEVYPTGENGCLRRPARLPHGPGGSRGQQLARSTLGCLYAPVRAKGLPPLGKCSVCRAASLCETDESTLGPANRRKSPEAAPPMGIGPKRRTAAPWGRQRAFADHSLRRADPGVRQPPAMWAVKRSARNQCASGRHPPGVHMHRSPKPICGSAFVKPVRIMSQEPWWNCPNHGSAQTAAEMRELWRPPVE